MRVARATPVTDTDAAIESESQYRSVVHELSKRARPPLVLRMLMNALESYRQARKMGWSRPQNKAGVKTFHSFELDAIEDRALIERALYVLAEEFPESRSEDRIWLGDLVNDSNLRAFVFVHDVVDNVGRFEGATLSLGRPVPASPRHRDRFDLIVESSVIDGRSVGICRVRAFVDPFRTPIGDNPPRSFTSQSPGEPAASLFVALAHLYARYRDVPEKAWQHWTQDYIDYFGPRTAPVHGSFFPTPLDRAYSDLVSARRAAGSAVQPVP